MLAAVGPCYCISTSFASLPACNIFRIIQPFSLLAARSTFQTGVPINVQALTINRLCGSGFETVAQGAQAIQLGLSKVSICGGAENMSAAPMTIDGNAARLGVPLGKVKNRARK